MLKVEKKDGAVEFEVIARPKARRNGIDGVHDSALKISITASPDKWKANKAIIKFLSRELGVSPSSIEIVSGLKSRRKRVRVRDVSVVEVKKLGMGGED